MFLPMTQLMLRDGNVMQLARKGTGVLSRPLVAGSRGATPGWGRAAGNDEQVLISVAKLFCKGLVHPRSPDRSENVKCFGVRTRKMDDVLVKTLNLPKTLWGVSLESKTGRRCFYSETLGHMKKDCRSRKGKDGAGSNGSKDPEEKQKSVMMKLLGGFFRGLQQVIVCKDLRCAGWSHSQDEDIGATGIASLLEMSMSLRNVSFLYLRALSSAYRIPSQSYALSCDCLGACDESELELVNEAEWLWNFIYEILCGLTPTISTISKDVIVCYPWRRLCSQVYTMASV
ncbi:hypothetical protein Tco_1080668 [Tanacetum coccineum]|uniref:Uncharacterized protein n=1 Tax=Tanacetum coccineum TaxID=301880 RepID=A0ABQ5HXA3_9ASTR